MINFKFQNAMPNKGWNQYWDDLASGKDYAQVKEWTDAWGADPNFPWSEVIQDYLNWSAGGERSAGFGDKGELLFGKSPFESPVIGMATPESTTAFGWGPEQITNYNQNVQNAAQMSQILPLYDVPQNLVQRQQQIGMGSGPTAQRNTSGFGGTLLSSKSAGGLTPFGAAEQRETPIAMGTQLLGGM